jgi:LPS-assembly protein
VQRFEGFFLKPDYLTSRAPARAARRRASTSSTKRDRRHRRHLHQLPGDGSGDPAWMLSTDSVRLDFANNEGVPKARAALLWRAHPRGAAHELSADRRAQVGLAAAEHGLDSKSGCSWRCRTTGTSRRTATPPSRPRSARAAGRRWTTEFRYLEPQLQGEAQPDLLPTTAPPGARRAMRSG